MKKTILTLAIGLFSASAMHACKAWPYPMTFTQSDGSQITVVLHGDEHFNWYTDLQGNVLRRKGNDFEPAGVTAEQIETRAAAAHRKAARHREPIAPAANLFPHTGTPRAAVILAQYPDQPFTLPNPRASFDQYLNSTSPAGPVDMGHGEQYNRGSVRQYFMAQSDSAFAPQFDIYGPITLPRNMAYYGGTSDDGQDERASELVADACTAVVDSVDLAQYDGDGDGNIDLVYVIYAGYGQSSGGPVETMWPKAMWGSSGKKYDGKGINRCGISNELLGYEGVNGYIYNEDHTDSTAIRRINGIGLFCHEFSHCLGLPDFYPTAGRAQGMDNQGMEDWSLMDSGEYVYRGYCPTAYTAWEREAMGWGEIRPITEAGQYRLTNIFEGGHAVKVVNPTNAREYYVLQLFEDKGWNVRMARVGSSYNPQTRGLLVYHVNYDNSFMLSNNTVNNAVGAPRMTVVPADGTLLTSYRVNSEKPGFGITSRQYAESLHGDLFREDASFAQGGGLPNGAWWTAAAETPIYNINYKDGAVYFDYLKRVAATGIDRRTDDKRPSTDKIYTIDGRCVGTSAEGLPHGIYIRGGKKFVI